MILEALLEGVASELTLLFPPTKEKVIIVIPG